MFVCGSVGGLVFLWLRGHNWGRRGNIFSDRVAKYGNTFIFSIISAISVTHIISYILFPDNAFSITFILFIT